MTTIRDVAEHAQVSVGTVSRAMNNHPSVSPAIRQVVLAAIDELQLRPNAITRTLRTAKTRTLGLLIPNMRNADVAASVIAGTEAAAQAHGYSLFVANAQRDRDIEGQHLRSLLERRVDGVLCNPTMPLETVHDLVQRAGVPTVVFGRPVPNGLLPATVLSFAAATEQAIDHLLDLGHRRIGTVTHAADVGLEVNVSWGVQFIHRALRERGVEMVRAWHPVVHSTEACARGVQAMFRASRRPTALFVTPLHLVPAAFEGMRAAGAGMAAAVTMGTAADRTPCELVSSTVGKAHHVGFGCGRTRPLPRRIIHNALAPGLPAIA